MSVTVDETGGTMAKRKHKELVVGIDVSAKTLQVALRTLTGDVRDLEFTNDAIGHRKLCDLLAKGRGRARACLEATSLYGLDVAIALHRAGVEVMVANPKAAKRFIEACMQRAKTDRVDARGLLEFALRMDFVPWIPPSDGRLALRMFARRLSDLVAQSTAEQNRLHALRATTTTPAFVLEDVQASIAEIQKRTETLIERALQLVASDPELAAAHAVVTSVKGIAERSSIALLGELLLLPAELTVREVVAHAGLDPRPKESGTSVHGRRAISRIGNTRLRAALYMPALVAIQREPAIRDHYQALVAEGKLKMVAIVAVMRKLLHSLWRMIHTGTAFDGRKYSQRQVPAA